MLTLHPAVFALLRTSPQGDEQVLALTNVSGEPVTVDLSGVALDDVRAFHDVLSGRQVSAGEALRLEPYDVLWLKAER